MKALTLTISIILINVIAAVAQQKATPELGKSVVNWTGHAEIGGYAPAGTIKLKSCTINFKGAEISSADVVMDMPTLSQENQNLTDHLKSEDFFDVKKFPASTIHISRIDNGIAYGSLTIKDKTHDISFPIKVDQTGNQVTVTGKTVIDRTQYGVVYNSTSFFSNLGDHAIRNTFDIAFTLVVMH